MPSVAPVLERCESHEARGTNRAGRRSAQGGSIRIRSQGTAGIFDTEIEAARAGYRQIGIEPFLIKHIVEADVPLIFTSFNIGV